MGILDGFLFWIGKALAEFTIFVFIVLVFGALLFWAESRNEREKKRRSAAPPRQSEEGK